MHHNPFLELRLQRHRKHAPRSSKRLWQRTNEAGVTLGDCQFVADTQNIRWLGPGCIGSPFVQRNDGKSSCVQRSPIQTLETLSNSIAVDLAQLALENFSQFSLAIQRVDGLVSTDVGGTLATASSAWDPLYWVHHANLDRLWAIWQDCHRAADSPEGAVASVFPYTLEELQANPQLLAGVNVKYSDDTFTDPEVSMF